MCVDRHIINEKLIILKSEATVEMRSIFGVCPQVSKEGKDR